MARPRSTLRRMYDGARGTLLVLVLAGSSAEALADTTADRVLGQLALTLNGLNLTDDAGLFNPTSVAIDRSVLPNRIYVSEIDNNRVLAWADVTAFTAGDAADFVIGQPDFLALACNNGGVSAASLCVPRGVAVDAAGNLYVADGNNNRVLEYDTPFASDATADRVFGQGGSFTTAACNLGGRSADSLCFPQGVALDGDDNLYIGDSSNHRVLEYDTPLASGTTADRVFGQGGSFTTGICNSGGASADTLCFPAGVAVDGADNVYVADSSNNRVLEYDAPLASGTTADRVFGQGGSFMSATCNLGGLSADSLCSPRALVADGTGNLYVADTFNQRVLGYDTPVASGTTADRVFGKGGSFVTIGCNVGGVSADSLCSPQGVALDGAGNLYVADTANQRVLEYDTPLASGTTADRVLGQPSFALDGPNLVDARGLHHPFDVAIDRSVVPNRVYVADTLNHRVLAWADAAGFANGDPADLVLGHPDFLSSTCDQGNPTADTLCFPRGVAVDGAGNVYVADTQNGRVLEYDAPFAGDTTADRVFGTGGSFTTAVCDVGAWSADGLCRPMDVAVDAAGNLYVADDNDHRVLQYDTPLVSDTTADRVFGQGGSFTTATCNLGGASADSLCSPRGLALDPAGNLYVADVSNHRVLQYDTPLGTDTTADRVFGQGGSFATTDCNLGGVSADGLCQPDRVAVDGAGTVYVADAGNNRVLAYATPLAADTTADVVYGQGGSFTSDTCNLGGVSADSLCLPLGVAVDGAENLYVADFQNHRVLVYEPSAACGNGVIEGPEECDDGNTLDGDCCASTCQYEALAAPCDADTDACTQDQCDGNGSCVFVAENPELCIDHVLCYKTTSLVPFSRRTVSLVDQLETADADVVRPRSLCLPASKNGGAVLDPVTHAEEYRIKSALAHVRRRGVVVTDQFGTLTVDTVKAERLLVPTNKSLMGPATPPSPGVADHYKCYKVKVRAPKFPKGIQATVADQFEDRLYDVKKPRHLCVPASKDGEPLVHPVAHLMCYEVKRAREEPKHVRRFGVQVANQFGAETLDSVREETLCVPALKTLP